MSTLFQFHTDFLSSLEKRLSSLPLWYRLSDKAITLQSVVKDLNLDFLHSLLGPLYSPIGRPAKNQIQIFRSLLLKTFLKFDSLYSWVNETRNNAFYAALCGFEEGSIPSISSYYDFLDRVFLSKTGGKNSRYGLKNRFFKPEGMKNLKKGQKYKDPNAITTSELLSKLEQTENPLERQREKICKEIFAAFLELSFKLLDLEVKPVNLSGDGTCVHTRCNPHGHHVKDTPLNRSRISSSLRHEEIVNIYSYSDPDVTVCWDSDKKEAYIGHYLYMLCQYVRLNNGRYTDLPVHLHMPEKPAQHDSLSLIEAWIEYAYLHPYAKPEYICLDSAHDNTATYRMFHEAGVEAVIDRNRRRSSTQKNDQTALKTDQDGNPICPSGKTMRLVKETSSTKRWICPLAADRTPLRETKKVCSEGGSCCVEMKNIDWARNLGTGEYRSEEWKRKYNCRTSSERVNNRILNDYGIHQQKCHGRKRYFPYIMLAAMCIHIEAWIKNRL